MSQRRYRIVTIVEGDGEAEAVPTLVEKWLRFRRFHNFEVSSPAINSGSRDRMLVKDNHEKHVGLGYYIKRAMLGQPDLILVVFDTDSIDPSVCNALRRSTEARMMAAGAGVPIGLVLPRPEYEVWFLAGWRILRDAEKLKPDAFLAKGEPLEDRSGGCKSRVGEMVLWPSYKSGKHQLALTQALKFTRCMKRSPSFVDLMNILECLTRKARRKDSSNSLCTVKPAGQEPEAQ